MFKKVRFMPFFVNSLRNANIINHKCSFIITEYRATRKHLCKDYDEYVNAAWITDSKPETRF